MSTPPAIVVVQGAFQTPDFYAAFESQLRTLGLETVHVQLPTCTDVDAADHPTRTVSHDAAAVYNTTRALVDAGKTVIVLMHSYGALVGTEAVTRDLTHDDRKARGLPGGVVHLIMLGCFTPDLGFSFLKSRGGVLPDDLEVHADGRYYCRFHDSLFNDFSAVQRAEWAPRLIAHSAAIMSYEITHVAWKFIPCTAIILDQDCAIPPPFQEASAQATGAKIVHVDAGHEAFISATDATAMAVMGIVEGVVGA